MKKIFYLYNGRSAFNFFLASQKLSIDDEILYPNYSCDVLFQNLNQKYNYKFYDIHKNFKFSNKLIKEKITKKTKIILIINFFGMNQNFKKIYNFCKKKNIILVVDECHTYYNFDKINNKNFDVRFFSPSKIFNSIEIGAVLQINTKRIKIDYGMEMKTINNNFIKKFKQIIKRIIFFDNLKYYFGRPNYEDINAFSSKIDICNFFLSKRLIKKIKLINFEKERRLRLKNFLFWVKLCKKLGVKPLLKITDVKHGCPYLFPAICKDKHKASQMFDFGWKNKIEISSWPTLHNDQKKNKQLVNYWKKIVYFPMDKEFYLNKKLLNE